jgi:hypothetical protein
MIWQTLAQVLQVRPVRISNIIVNHDGKDLPVTFTLLDAPPRLGPVAVPLQELSLTAAIAKLRTVIDSNMLNLRAKFNTTEVTLTARNNSLQIIYTSNDQSGAQCANQTTTASPATTTSPSTATNPSTTTSASATACPATATVPEPTIKQIIEITYNSSGPLITGFWIGFIILGLLVGLVGGFFVSKRFVPQ